MSNIILLDKDTINQIAAGEVVERPAAVVKELIENAMDAGAGAITIEIKEGGIAFIRITDNGTGIEKEDIRVAFLRHSTSKIKSIEDLIEVTSLGFRGEALSSIAAVSQVELVTKTSRELTGVRYIIEGGVEKVCEEIGCPQGTTFLIRNLFFNIPARKKFLKSAATEAGYISDLIEKLALSRPDISFKFIINNKIKLQTSGNGIIRDVIYHIYGREVATNLIEVNTTEKHWKLFGLIGNPSIARGNRGYETYFINQRYIKSGILYKAIEEAYKPYTMTHKYPFTVLQFTIDSNFLDINVHPTKMELRFQDGEKLYHFTYCALKEALSEKELIPSIELSKEEKIPKQRDSIFLSQKEHPIKLDNNRVILKQPNEVIIKEKTAIQPLDKSEIENKVLIQPAEKFKTEKEERIRETNGYMTNIQQSDCLKQEKEQLCLFEDNFISKGAIKEHRVIGQVFSTYWIVQYQTNLFFIDQHAAHEKVLYEKTMKQIKEGERYTQVIYPPIILSFSIKEEEILNKYLTYFQQLGFEIEPFGGREYSIREVPTNFFDIAKKELFLEVLDSLIGEAPKKTPELILEKVASYSCKAAVKGKQQLSYEEVQQLIDDLLELENPYYCPHGRPTIISISQLELEKKFKRIV